MSADRLLSVEEARRAVFAAITGPTPAEVAWLIEARGRVVAETVTSPIDLPPWDNSAMDGYAIRAADVAAATEDGPTSLEVIGEVRAGQAPEVTVRARQRGPDRDRRPGATGRRRGRARSRRPRRSTPPVRPPDRVVGTRRVRCRPGSLVHIATPVGGSIRRAGSDLAAGTPILGPGTVVTPAALSLAAGVGLDQLNVHRRPIVGILATGDEVRPPGQRPGRGGYPGRQRPGSRRDGRGGRRRPAGPGDRQGSPRRRQVPHLRRADRGRRRADRVGWGVGRAVRRRPRRVRGLRNGGPVAGRGPARQAVRLRDGTSTRRRRRPATDPRRSCSGCRATRSRPSSRSSCSSGRPSVASPVIATTTSSARSIARS